MTNKLVDVTMEVSAEYGEYFLEVTVNYTDPELIGVGFLYSNGFRTIASTRQSCMTDTVLYLTGTDEATSNHPIVFYYNCMDKDHAETLKEEFMQLIDELNIFGYDEEANREYIKYLLNQSCDFEPEDEDILDIDYLLTTVAKDLKLL